MPPSVSIGYHLLAPQGIQTPPNLQPITQRDFHLKANDAGHYASLRVAIAEAKEVLGKELTAWRDAVGKAEAEKEAKTKKKDGIDGEEEDDDDEAVLP